MQIRPYRPQIRQNNLKCTQAQVSNPQGRIAQSDVAFGGGYNLGIFIPKSPATIVEKIGRRTKALELLGLGPDAAQQQIQNALSDFSRKVQLETLIEKTGFKPLRQTSSHFAKMADIKENHKIKRMMEQYGFSSVDELQKHELEIISNKMKDTGLLTQAAPTFLTNEEKNNYARSNRIDFIDVPSAFVDPTYEKYSGVAEKEFNGFLEEAEHRVKEGLLKAMGIPDEEAERLYGRHIFDSIKKVEKMVIYPPSGGTCA